MTLTPRGFEDIALDHAVTILTAYVVAQKAAYLAANPGATAAQQTAAVGFMTERDRMSPADDDALLIQPLVVLGFDSETPNGGSKTQKHSIARFFADLKVAKGEGLDGLKVSGDKGAKARLLYLKAQVEAGWFNLANYHLGFAVGTLAGKPWGSFQDTTGLTDADQGGEHWEVSGRWTFELPYEWAPDSPQGVALEEINVDTGLWSAFYDYT